MSNTPCLDAFDRTIASIRRNAANAVRRNKPTMWAYFGRMEEGLTKWFGATVDATRSATCEGRALRGIDGGIAGVALALVQRSEKLCPTMPRDEAADLWALGTYANRILRAWTSEKGPSPFRRSLAWLRQRQESGT